MFHLARKPFCVQHIASHAWAKQSMLLPQSMVKSWHTYPPRKLQPRPPLEIDARAGIVTSGPKSESSSLQLNLLETGIAAGMATMALSGIIVVGSLGGVVIAVGGIGSAGLLIASNQVLPIGGPLLLVFGTAFGVIWMIDRTFL
jgi:hypothetical protein